MRALTEAEKLQNELGVDGIKYDEEKWKSCIRNYVECEFWARGDEMIAEVDWNELVQKDWRFCLEVSLMSLISMSISSGKENLEEWKIRLKLVSDLFSIKNLEFSPSIVPATIRFGFKNRNPSFPNELTEFLRTVRLSDIDDRIRLAEDENTVEAKIFYRKIETFLKYLNTWSREIAVDKYCSLRSNEYSREITELTKRYDEFKRGDGVLGREGVIEKITEIEESLLTLSGSLDLFEIVIKSHK